jgi:hypothetical protein
MYCTLTKVIMRREGKGEQETKPRNAKEPVNKVGQGRTGARGSLYTDQLGSSYARRLAPHHSALQQEVNKGLCLCAPVVYL